MSPEIFSPPSAERVTLHVTGMTCGTCALRVRKALREVPGVFEAEVNFATHSARVVRGAGQADEPLLIAAVVRAGYGASLVLPARQELARREEEERKEGRGWLARAVLGGASTTLLVAFHHAGHPGAPGFWPVVLFATAIQIGLGLPFYKGAWKGLKSLTGNMDLLVSMGATAGFALAAAQAFGRLSDTGVHFDCAPAVLSVVSLGKYLEARARRRAGQAVRGLMEMVPPRATVLRDGKEQEIGIEEVRLGDHVRVPPNAPVPVDGVVLKGASQIDESSMTGESQLVSKTAGDRVITGTLNGPGPLEVRAERVGEETLLGQVVARVESAQASRASASRLADRVASVLVPAVLVAALVGTWTTGFVAGTSVLLAACPCALGLAIPAALAVGVGLAARRGVLFRDVESLERAAKVKAVYFDKTGTLTRGQSLAAWAWHPTGEDPAEVLRLAASAEKHETHPAARALVRQALDQGLALEEPSRVDLVPGGGVAATLASGEVLVGSAAFLKAHGVDILTLAPKLAEAEAAGLGTVCVARGGRVAGLFAVAEAARPEAEEALRALQSMHLSVGMLSGDRPERAKALGAALGIADVRGGTLPDQKADAARGAAMVGDGVNDSAALASADLGIAMGAGAALAREAAGVTLLGSDLRAVPWTLALARATRRVITENLVWAFGYNLLAVPAALLGHLAPWQAAALMALSDLVVIGNALTLPWRVPAWRK